MEGPSPLMLLKEALSFVTICYSEAKNERYCLKLGPCYFCLLYFKELH